jgi:vacuolar-type H+-ATPase subunit I/STV1
MKSVFTVIALQLVLLGSAVAQERKKPTTLCPLPHYKKGQTMAQINEESRQYIECRRAALLKEKEAANTRLKEKQLQQQLERERNQLNAQIDREKRKEEQRRRDAERREKQRQERAARANAPRTNNQ